MGASHGGLAGVDALYSGGDRPPVVINVCLTGIVPAKSSNGSVPISVGEIVEDACRVVEAGASMLHIHAREDDGRPSWRPELYERIFCAIRAACPEVVIVATTSGRSDSRFEHRAAVLDLDGPARPDMASLTLGSLNFPESASVNPPDVIQRLALRMRERGVKPELEVFDPGMLNYALYLRRKGLLEEPCYVNLILGSLGGMAARVSDLAYLVRDIPEEWAWAAAGVGRFQLPMNLAGLLMGGHVRVGLEDNLYMDFGKHVPATNLALVERLVRFAAELERPIATPQQTRAMLGLAAVPA
jgi:uncharacterized protein (DUF849 family)